MGYVPPRRPTRAVEPTYYPPPPKADVATDDDAEVIARFIGGWEGERFLRIDREITAP